MNTENTGVSDERRQEYHRFESTIVETRKESGLSEPTATATATMSTITKSIIYVYRWTTLASRLSGFGAKGVAFA